MTIVSLKSAALAAALAVGLGSVTVAQTPAPQQQPKAAKPAKPRTAQPAQAQQPPPSTGKSLCVASVIGHKFHVQAIGLTIFGNSLEDASTEAWGIDDLVLRKVTQLMGRQYAVRRLDVPRSVLTAYEGSHDIFKNPADVLVAGLRAAAGNSCDLVLVATRGVSSYGGTNQTLLGLGILNAGRPINERVYVSATFDLVLYDGKDFRRLKNTTPWTDPLLVGAFTGPGIRGMYRPVDTSWWPSSAQAAAQSEQLKSMTRTLVEQGLSQGVPALFKEDSEPQRGGAADRMGIGQ